MAVATTTSQTTPANNGDYYGTYKLENLPIDKIVVSDKGGSLYYVAGEYQDVLTPMTGKDKFDANGQSTFTFVRGDDMKVKSVVVNIQGQEITAQKETPKMDIDAYVGKYKMSGLPFENMEIMTKDGKLMIDAMGQVGELTPTANKDEFDAAGRATLQFVRNADQEVTGITLAARGMEFSGQKGS